MHRLHPQVGERQFLTPCERLEHPCVEMACGVKWSPAWSHDVAWVQHRRGEAVAPGFVEQVRLYLRFPDAILTEGMARQVFGRGNLRAVAVYPDGPTMQEMLYVAPQGFDQLAGAVFLEADQVHHRVRPQIPHPLPEGSGRFLRIAVQAHPLHGLPRGVRLVWFPLAAADADNIVPGLHQARRQECANVPAAPDHYYAHIVPPRDATAGSLPLHLRPPPRSGGG